MLYPIVDFILYHTPVFYFIQSIWRDEAFSYFMAKPAIVDIFKNTASDFNPPLYYLLLHVWMNIVGNSDIALRLLSFIPHLLTSYFAFKIGENLISNRFAKFMAIFTFLNPMLLYYAFEIRMYSLFAYLTISSLYFLYMLNWKWYTIFATLGLYTHSFFPLIIFSYAVYILIKFKRNKFKLFNKVLFPLLFYLPWMPILIGQFLRSQVSWLYPVDLQLILSSLGNLFTGYEGTPGSLWGLTSLLSFIIVIFLLISLRLKRKKTLLFLYPLFIPLVIILTYSLLKRPLYVNRYLIFVTVFEILGISMGIASISNKTWKMSSMLFWLILIISINLAAPQFHKKTDFKTTFTEINRISKLQDTIFAKTPIGFLESAFYYKNVNNVFVYNPDSIHIPDYIGVNVVFSKVSRVDFPPAPSRTFLVYDDASYELIVKQ